MIPFARRGVLAHAFLAFTARAGAVARPVLGVPTEDHPAPEHEIQLKLCRIIWLRRPCSSHLPTVDRGCRKPEGAGVGRVGVLASLWVHISVQPRRILRTRHPSSPDLISYLHKGTPTSRHRARCHARKLSPMAAPAFLLASRFLFLIFSILSIPIAVHGKNDSVVMVQNGPDTPPYDLGIGTFSTVEEVKHRRKRLRPAPIPRSPHPPHPCSRPFLQIASKYS